jgi:integrase
MRLIEGDPGLATDRKRHWMSSLRRIAAGISRPPEFLPARLTALRHPMARLNAARLGIEAKSLSNHRSNVKAAVLHVLKAIDAPRRGMPLSPVWGGLLAALTEVKARRLLSGLARYCSSRGLAPDGVSEAMVTDYFAHRAATSFLETGVGRLRELMRAWNRCVEAVPGWPRRPLHLPGVTPVSPGPGWESFPEGLRTDIDAYLRRLAASRRSANGKRRKPNKSSTIDTRRRELQAFARKAVASGVPIECLTSLAELLAPQVVVSTFERLPEEGGDTPRTYTVDLAWKLLSIAREIGASEDTITRLDDIRHRLEEERPPAMTEKNLGVIRAVMASDVWGQVIALPERFMAEAERLLNRSPRKAAALAAVAVQILIPTRAPVRVGNLMAIRLGYNLLRPGGEGAPFHLTFPNYDVKNRVDLEFPLSHATSALIQRYIDLFRPHLQGHEKTDWLFPGEGGNRSSSHASVTIAETVEREVGLRVTAHQFRHAAAATILKQRPGEFEFVRRILGHRNVQTTIRYYTGLEAFAASAQFGKLIEERLSVHPDAASRRKGRGGRHQ